MAALMAGDSAVLEGSIRLPRIGVWHADVRLDSETVPTNPITLKSENGGLEFRGTVVRGEVHNGSVGLRIVGGAGGLSETVPPKFYKSIPLRIPLSDLLSEVGESLSASSDNQTTERTLPIWTRFEGPAYTALAILLGAACWRVLPDGTVWVGDEAWPAVEMPFDLLEYDPALGRSVIATEALSLLPGVLLKKQRVSAVVHRVKSHRVRTEVFYER